MNKSSPGGDDYENASHSPLKWGHVVAILNENNKSSPGGDDYENASHSPLKWGHVVAILNKH